MGLFGKSRRNRRRSSHYVSVPPFSPTRARSGRSTLSPNARRAIKWIVGAVVLYLFLAGPQGAWNLLSLWRAEHALERKELALQAEIVELQIRHDKLESDTLYIERVARTDYNMAHPDEVIYEAGDSAP
ncbi:MAG: hypothetical protein Kow0074_09170 [Candidatus Zixiibacteriota bacterium]